MSQSQVKRRRSTSELIQVLLGIRVAVEGIDRTLELLVAAQGQPRVFVDDRCPADAQNNFIVPDGKQPAPSLPVA